MTIAPGAIIEVTPETSEQAEIEALGALIADFEGDGQDENKLTYLKHRYAGFRQREAAVLTGIKTSTIKRWIKDDPRVAHFDNQVSTGNRRTLRREVLQEEFFRNFHLAVQHDAYLFKKANGLLQETVTEVLPDGRRKQTVISPPMTKVDWEQYNQIRKFYTVEAWNTVEKVAKGQTTELTIDQLILNIAQDQQVNVAAPN